MEASLWSAWIAAAASLVALITNVVVQHRGSVQRSKHEAKMQTDQLEFQQKMLDQTAENEYAYWLRDKRLQALVNLQKSFDEVAFLNSKWGFKESQDRESWERFIEDVENGYRSALSEVNIVFSHHVAVLKLVTELMSYLNKMTSLVRLPFDQGQKLKTWETILKDRKTWIDESRTVYSKIWVLTHSIAFPLLHNEHTQD